MNKRAFYFRLALSNIRKNRKFYAPYILTGVGTAAMLYIMAYLTSHRDLRQLPGSASVEAFLTFGSVIIGIFAAIFLFYTNSFLMKQRKKEFGLYCVLGMEKRHLGLVQFHETLIVAFLSVSAGVACGILFSKLVLLLLCRIVRFEIPMGFTVSGIGIAVVAAFFLAVYFIILLFNLIHIARVSPAELMRESRSGQREPKTKWPFTVLGLLSLGGGYGIALTVKSPLSAIFLFFIAVLLVIIGTYCLFTSGSIAVLKTLRRNKRYYYQTRHFTNVSGMLYRMKQNAVGLGNICILSTMVLVMVSTTVALNIGMEDILNTRYPADISVSYSDPGKGVVEAAAERIRSLADENDVSITSILQENSVTILVRETENGFQTGDTDYYIDDSDIANLCFLTTDEYERNTGNGIELGENEALAYSKGYTVPKTFTLMDRTFTVREVLDENPASGKMGARIGKVYFFVVSPETFQFLSGNAAEESVIYVDVDADNDTQIAFFSAIVSELAEKVTGSYINESGETVAIEYSVMYGESRAQGSADFYSLYGGFLFLGIFLGLMFIMATILIIYYKQITEGYSDKERFRIMQQVGMSEREVKTSIRSQVLTVFFLPLLTAAVHVAFAFRIIVMLLAVLNLTNVSLFAWCTLGTFAVFALLYAAVYAVTAREYYRIVR
ncbi:MAG: ABC transporter permease [Clostridia bacterium]|nr:ABC transporter permease [Clostridia bacterium]